jgi:hypothetical protein
MVVIPPWLPGTRLPAAECRRVAVSLPPGITPESLSYGCRCRAKSGPVWPHACGNGPSAISAVGNSGTLSATTPDRRRSRTMREREAEDWWRTRRGTRLGREYRRVPRPRRHGRPWSGRPRKNLDGPVVQTRTAPGSAHPAAPIRRKPESRRPAARLDRRRSPTECRSARRADQPTSRFRPRGRETPQTLPYADGSQRPRPRTPERRPWSGR